jgi:hypothetical protein
MFHLCLWRYVFELTQLATPIIAGSVHYITLEYIFMDSFIFVSAEATINLASPGLSGQNNKVSVISVVLILTKVELSVSADYFDFFIR